MEQIIVRGNKMCLNGGWKFSWIMPDVIFNPHAKFYNSYYHAGSERTIPVTKDNIELTISGMFWNVFNLWDEYFAPKSKMWQCKE
jgi:hypothetical protein